MTQRGPLVLVACAVAIAAAWMGWRAYSASHASFGMSVPVPAGMASPINPSDELPDPPVAAPKIPVLMPVFALKNLKGKTTPISTWAGKSLVINFWATWCAPCRREIPLLKTLNLESVANGRQIVGIAVDYADKVEDFAEQFKISYPLLVGEQDAMDVAAQFGVPSPGFPFTVFTDRRGEVVTLFLGELHRPQIEVILSTVGKVDRGQLALEKAREQIATALSALAAESEHG